MPNHLHLLIRPFDSFPLEDILGRMKGAFARRLNRELGRSGKLWQQESYDRIVRDGEHLARVIRYIGQNPVKAGLPPEAWHRWIRPEWEAAGWGFDV